MGLARGGIGARLGVAGVLGGGAGGAQLLLLAAALGDVVDDGDDADEPMRVVVVLEPEAGGTRISQTMTFPTAEMRAGALAFGADKLGQTTLAKLEAAAQKL